MHTVVTNQSLKLAQMNEAASYSGLVQFPPTNLASSPDLLCTMQCGRNGPVPVLSLKNAWQFPRLHFWEPWAGWPCQKKQHRKDYEKGKTPRPHEKKASHSSTIQAKPCLSAILATLPKCHQSWTFQSNRGPTCLQPQLKWSRRTTLLSPINPEIQETWLKWLLF